MALRKKLHNELVDLKGNIRVFCRLRPQISEDGTGPDSKMVIRQDPRDEQLIIVDNKVKECFFNLKKIPAFSRLGMICRARRPRLSWTLCSRPRARKRWSLSRPRT
jgi:hypothetical protein